MPESRLNANWLASRPTDERRRFLSSLSDLEAEVLLYDWSFWARVAQQAPQGQWGVWLLLAGRGFGKTRSGAEWVRRRVEAGAARIAVLAPTMADARDVMVEGESGLLSVFPRWNRPEWQPSNRRLTWPNDSVAHVYSADEPDRLRGPQFDTAWCDEIAAWRYPEAWDMLMLGLRLGRDPRCTVTTTPRPTSLIRSLLKRSDCVVTRGTTYDNAANLASAFIDQIVRTYEGTRLGRQEIHAEVLEDDERALWQRIWIERSRSTVPAAPKRVVVGVDPPASDTSSAAECGIVVVGLGADDTGYVLADYSVKGSPVEWATRAVTAYRDFAADRLVAEVNQGGDMVEAVLRQVDQGIAYRSVRASRGKWARAEPVAALYEQGRVRHAGVFEDLEDQMCRFVQSNDTRYFRNSPDRVDALVWAITDLMLSCRTEPRIRGL